MSDSLLSYIRLSLPDEIRQALTSRLLELEQGNYEAILSQPLARSLLGHDSSGGGDNNNFDSTSGDWNDFVFTRLERLLANRSATGDDILEHPSYRQHFFVLVAVAALQIFIQANVTGPPLPFSSSALIFPKTLCDDDHSLAAVRGRLVKSLTVDGEAAYKLTPNIELLCLTDTILICPPIKKNVKAAEWAKLRKDFIHQRLLTEVSPTLQTSIYEGLDAVKDLLDGEMQGMHDLRCQFLLEEAAVHIHHGLDRRAREILEQAARERKFEFALTGSLGKRTKYQEKDISQLVVIARSHDERSDDDAKRGINGSTSSGLGTTKPENLDLNDDTLLERISFTPNSKSSVDILDNGSLPKSLRSLDPGNQPLLHPLDSTILLQLASAITNRSPADGLTREETLPYATRVLEGGSSNWQVYTQALLVRSRIEGYRSRTIERGLLQLQALVDQVIAETTPKSIEMSLADRQATTFLPRAKESESAPANERLKYVYELSSPTRWELEAELAARWVSLGGLRSALEIYERLEMWAEAALCWAAVEQEDKAKKLVRRQLFHATSGAENTENTEEEMWEGEARDPPPADAPRLYCILGDIGNDINQWEKAWEVSNGRYARAQRSLGRHYFSANDYIKAADAYAKALKINQLNQSSWFALGCCLLELTDFEKASAAFSRTVQLDDTDAEAWSNLAAALLRKETPIASPGTELTSENANEDLDSRKTSLDPQQNRKDALQALKRAATLKNDNARIWDNLLTVAASVKPPAYADIVIAQTRIIQLRGRTEGESCIDVMILEHLVRHVIATAPAADEAVQRGLPRLVCEMIDNCVIPLITASARLWRIVGTLAVWRRRPGGALEAHEKAWRAATAQPGWEVGSEEQWEEVVEATSDLVDAYESFGGSEREGSEELVAKDWRFKARSAIRSIMGKGKENWEDSLGWERLKERMEGLKTLS